MEPLADKRKQLIDSTKGMLAMILVAFEEGTTDQSLEYDLMKELDRSNQSKLSDD